MIENQQSSSGVWQIAKLPYQIKWTPKYDITLHELSKCVPFFAFCSNYSSAFSFYSGLPDDCKRHFEVIEWAKLTNAISAIAIALNICTITLLYFAGSDFDHLWMRGQIELTGIMAKCTHRSYTDAHCFRLTNVLGFPSNRIAPNLPCSPSHAKRYSNEAWSRWNGIVRWI